MKVMKQFLITGTSTGIGKALAEYFLEQGHKVTGISRSNVVLGDHYSHYMCDLSDTTQRQNLFDTIAQGGVLFDIFIANAGVGIFGGLESMEKHHVSAMIETNLVAHIELTRLLLAQIEEDGSLIYIGSMASRKFMKYGAVYQATKFGLRGFAGGIAKEVSQSVHFLNPKIVDTPFHTQSKKYHHHGETKMEDIITCVDKMVSGEEKRFEVDC